MKTEKLLYVILAALVLTASVLAVIVVIELKSNTENDVNALINEIDLDLSSGFYSEAQRLLLDYAVQVKTSKQGLSALKRADIIYRNTSDLNFYKKLAVNLNNKFPNSIDIKAILAFIDTKLNYEKSIPEQYLQDLKYSGFFELYLIANLDYPEKLNDKKLKKKLNQWQQLLLYSELTDISENDLSESGILKYDRKILLDLALLKAQSGDFQSADSYLKDIDAEYFTEVRTFLAYDMGNYNKAASLINELKSDDPFYSSDKMQMFRADIYMQSGMNDKASALYRHIIESSPDYSAVPYYNLFKMNKAGTGFEYLKQGLKYFPDNKDLLVEALKSPEYSKNVTEVSEITAKLMDLYSNDPEIQLMYLINSSKGRSAEFITGNLWNIFNIDKGNEKVFIYFYNFLLKIRNLAEASELVDSFSKNYRPASENVYLNYKAVLSILNGDFSDAYSVINNISSRDALSMYNKAVIQALNGDNTAAIENLKYASTLKNIDKDNLIKIYFKTAETYYNLKQTENALKQLGYIEKLDKSYLKADLLKNKIETEYYD